MYEESYLPPRCRKLQYRPHEEFVQAELSETTMSSLQLAFEDNSYEGAGKIYAYQGLLWRRAIMRDICAGGEDEYGYHTPLEALIWWNEHGSTFFRTDYDRTCYKRDTSKESVLRDMQERISQYLLVDGELFCRTDEPMYCITTFGSGHNHGGTSLFVDYRYNLNIYPKAYFSALRKGAGMLGSLCAEMEAPI